MVDTPVCKHGWPIFDQDPCPDCLREIDACSQTFVTEPVTSSSDDIPEFLKRTVGGKVSANANSTGTPVSEPPKGAAPSAMGAVSTYTPDTGLGSVSRRLDGFENPDDVAMRAKLLTESAVKSKNKTETRLQKAGFKTGREGDYAEGKTWDTVNSRWV